MRDISFKPLHLPCLVTNLEQADAVQLTYVCNPFYFLRLWALIKTIQPSPELTLARDMILCQRPEELAIDSRPAQAYKAFMSVS